jgi:hypothetical protein
MEDFQLRVVDEKRELDVKVQKLHMFMMSYRFEKLPQPEKDRLERQHIAMCQYSGVLGERINGFASA